MPFTYRPILKTKAGEAVALLQLANADKDRIQPIFQVSEKPPATFVNKMSNAWSGRRCFLDGAFNFNATGAANDFNNIFVALGGAGVPVIPVLEIGAASPYNQAAGAFVGQYAPGVLLKCTPATLTQVGSWVQALNQPANDIDLLIDAGHIAEYEPVSFAGYIKHVLSQIPSIGWRSVTLTASSAPKDFGQLSLGTSIIPRVEWMVWSNLPQIPGRPIDFSDFGISHRDLTEPPGVAMAGATVSVRYTIDNSWVMIKGRRTTGASGVPMGNQYRAHAQTLVARPDFDGLANCWADQRISAIATNPNISAGGRPQWVEINANRHLAFIISRLP